MLYRPISEIIARRAGKVLRSADDLPAAIRRRLQMLATSSSDESAPFASGAAESVASAPRLLVVEDDWFVSMDIQSTLADGGYDVVDVVRTADDAVQSATRHRPALVLMDIRLLGERDGVDAARDIRDALDIPCLFVSAHTDEATKARAAPARPAGWLMKPFMGQELLDAVGRALRGAGEHPDPA